MNDVISFDVRSMRGSADFTDSGDYDTATSRFTLHVLEITLRVWDIKTQQCGR